LIGAKFMTDQSGKSNHEVADYIATMTAHLAQMAAAQNFILLAHLLEMAWLEAEQLCGRDSIAPRRRSSNG
jgi:hypothetical protein